MGGKGRPQANVPLDERELLALRAMATRDEVSVSVLLRPVVAGYIKRRLKRDPDLAASVKALQRSRQGDVGAKGATVTPLKPQARSRRGRSPKSGDGPVDQPQRPS